MTDTALDPFESIRTGLLTAATRDLARRRRRTRATLGTLATIITLFIATGLAAAANDTVARKLDNLPGGSVFDVFHGDAKPDTPTPASYQASSFLGRIGDGDPGSAHAIGPEKILLHETVRGVDVAVIAQPFEFDHAAKMRATCFALSTDQQRGMASCSPVMNPRLPVNFGTSTETSRDHVRTMSIVGITDDTVASIDVVTFVGVEPATMGDHAFYWASRPGHMPSYIRIHQKNGEILESSEGLPGRIDPKDL
jgi:hypothetical protein